MNISTVPKAFLLAVTVQIGLSHWVDANAQGFRLEDVLRGIVGTIIENGALEHSRSQPEDQRRQAEATYQAAKVALCQRRFGPNYSEVPDFLARAREDETLAAATAAALACRLPDTPLGVSVKASDGTIMGHLTAVLADAESQQLLYWLVFDGAAWVAFNFGDAYLDWGSDAINLQESAVEIPMSVVLPDYKLAHDGIVGPGMSRAIASAGLKNTRIDSTLIASVGGWGLVPSDKVEISISSVPDGAAIHVGSVAHGSTSISGWIRRDAVNSITVSSSGYLPCSIGNGARVEGGASALKFICELVPEGE